MPAYKASQKAKTIRNYDPDLRIESIFCLEALRDVMFELNGPAVESDVKYGRFGSTSEYGLIIALRLSTKR